MLYADHPRQGGQPKSVTIALVNGLIALPRAINSHSLVQLIPITLKTMLLLLQTEGKKSLAGVISIITDTKIGCNLRRNIDLKIIQLTAPALLAYAYLESASSEQPLSSQMVHESEDMQ